MNNNEMQFPYEMYSKTSSGVLVEARFHKNTMELAEITAGEAAVQIGTEIIYAKAGDILYIPPNMTFRAEAEEGIAGIRGISFDASIIETNMLSYETEILYMFYVQSENRVKIFTEGHPSYPVLSRAMSEAYDEYVSKDVCYKLVIRAGIYRMMTELLRYYCVVKTDDDKSVYHNVLRLRPVIDYISQHSCEKITIDALAGIIMVSDDYFTKMFKKSIGKTPIDYINAIRVNHALELLISTDASMPEIADKVGFCNANYFHRIFKQYMNTSPLAYRKSNKPKEDK